VDGVHHLAVVAVAVHISSPGLSYAGICRSSPPIASGGQYFQSLLPLIRPPAPGPAPLDPARGLAGHRRSVTIRTPRRRGGAPERAAIRPGLLDQGRDASGRDTYHRVTPCTSTTFEPAPWNELLSWRWDHLVFAVNHVPARLVLPGRLADRASYRIHTPLQLAESP